MMNVVWVQAFTGNISCVGSIPIHSSIPMNNSPISREKSVNPETTYTAIESIHKNAEIRIKPHGHWLHLHLCHKHGTSSWTLVIKLWQSLPNVIIDLVSFKQSSESGPSNSVLSYRVKTSGRAVQPISLDIKVTTASHPIFNALHKFRTGGDTYKTLRYEALTSWLQPETLIKQPAAAEFTGKLYEREFFICCELLPMLSWATSQKSSWFLEVRNGRGKEIIVPLWHDYHSW